MWRVFAACLLAPAVSALLQAAPPSDGEWKRWLDEVRPLLQPSEETTAKKLPPQARNGFREGFWQLRAPDPASPDNPVRREFERRVSGAEKRFKVNGKGAWNDCGRTYLLLGQPTWVKEVATEAHFAGADALAAFRDQDERAAEVWSYRNHPRLPPAPEGYAFQFTPNCDLVGSPTAVRLLQGAAESYVMRDR